MRQKGIAVGSWPLAKQCGLAVSLDGRTRKPPPTTFEKHSPMPLDTAVTESVRTRPFQAPCLNDAERQAAACFGPKLWAALAHLPGTHAPTVVIAHLSDGVAMADFRFAVAGSDEAMPWRGETTLAHLHAGLPDSVAERRALAVRLASAAAGAWRQHCHLQRLGLLAE